jgi:hypothetical protein
MQSYQFGLMALPAAPSAALLLLLPPYSQVHCYIATCLRRHADVVPECREEVAAVAAAVQNMYLTATALGANTEGRLICRRGM